MNLTENKEQSEKSVETVLLSLALDWKQSIVLETINIDSIAWEKAVRVAAGAKREDILNAVQKVLRCRWATRSARAVGAARHDGGCESP